MAPQEEKLLEDGILPQATLLPLGLPDRISHDLASIYYIDYLVSYLMIRLPFGGIYHRKKELLNHFLTILEPRAL